MAGSAWQVGPPTSTLSLVPSTSSAFVQTASHQAAGSSATANFTTSITAGNSVVVAFQAGTSPSVTPASGPDTYTIDVTAGAGIGVGSPSLIYAHVSNSAGGYTGVTVSGGGGSTPAIVFIYEVAGPITFDTNTYGTGINGIFNLSYTPGHAGEFLVGMVIDSIAAANIMDPTGGGRWTQSAITAAMAQSYQGTVGTSAVPYQSLATGSGNTAAAVAGYVVTNSGIPATPTSGCVLFYTNGQLWALGQSGHPGLLATT